MCRCNRRIFFSASQPCFAWRPCSSSSFQANDWSVASGESMSESTLMKWLLPEPKEPWT